MLDAAPSDPSQPGLELSGLATPAEIQSEVGCRQALRSATENYRSVVSPRLPSASTSPAEPDQIVGANDSRQSIASLAWGKIACWNCLPATMSRVFEVYSVFADHPSISVVRRSRQIVGFCLRDFDAVSPEVEIWLSILTMVLKLDCSRSVFEAKRWDSSAPAKRDQAEVS